MGEHVINPQKKPLGKRKKQQIFGRSMLSFFLLLGGLTMIVPFVWMLSTSFKMENEVFRYPFEFITKNFSLNNYKTVWTGRNSFGIFFRNSIIVTVFSVTGQVLVSSLAAYAFARLDFTGKNVVFLLYISTMMIPTQVTIIPKFLMFDAVGMLDKHITIIIQAMFSVIGVFMLRQFFLTIPFELTESALIDGAGHLTIWWRIVMPLAKTAVTSLIILSFVWSWNEYQIPLIFLRKKEMYTIPLGIDFYIDDMGARYSVIMAASTSAILPVVLVFLCGQKQFIESIATAGIKG